MKKIFTILALGTLTACTKEPKKEFSVTPPCIEKSMIGRWYFYEGETATTFAWDSDMVIDSLGVDSFTATFPKYNLRVNDTVVFGSKALACNNKEFKKLDHVAFEKMLIKTSYYGASGDTLVDSFYSDGKFKYQKFYFRP